MMAQHASGAVALPSWPTPFDPPSDTLLGSLELEVQTQLRGPGEPILRLLGHGEVTVTVAYPTGNPVWACKRMPPVGAAPAAAHRDHVLRYIGELRTLGVPVVPTSCHVVPSGSDAFAVYLCQPIVPSELLGPEVLLAAEPDAMHPLIVRAFALVAAAIGPRIGIDMQLANWAWVDGSPWLLDVSTPFTTSGDGRPELDLSVVLAPFPALARPVLRTLVLPSVMARYHDLRACLLDFVANLQRERLGHWAQAALTAANHLVDVPLTHDEMERYYRSDARLWEMVYHLKRLERFAKRATGGTYQFLLPPPTDRWAV